MKKSEPIYTILAPMKSPAALREMQDFLSNNFRTPNEVFNKRFIGNSDHIYDCNKSTHIYTLKSNDSSKLRFQFNFRGDFELDLGFEIHEDIMHPLENEYIKSIVMWMSVRSGTKRILSGWKGLGPLKYYRFNGDIKVLSNQDFGWERKPDKWPTSWMTGFSKKNIDLIANEIERLDDIWDYE